jgi:hypothetical protein|tara:strand:+ start:232 stop:531 length:300 start_codon:yes stop_codon:yes gene_type:complete
MALNKQENDYYDALEEMIRTSGWQQYFMNELLEEVEMYEQMINYSSTVTDSQIRELRGRLFVLRKMIEFEKVLDMTKAEKEKESEIAEKEFYGNAQAAI